MQTAVISLSVYTLIKVSGQYTDKKLFCILHVKDICKITTCQITLSNKIYQLQQDYYKASVNDYSTLQLLWTCF